MTYSIKFTAAVAAIFALLALGGLVASTNLASAAFPNLNARIATSTVSVAGPQQVRTLFAERANCASRNITTSSSSVMISFNSDLLTPSLGNGHWQAASTTVAYDSALWGCNKVTVYGVASTSLTISEAIF